MKNIHQGFIIPNAVAYCFEYSVPELSLIEWVKENLTNINKDFIDVGAHVGTWSILLAPFFNQVISYEPQIDVYNCLCGNIAIHELSSKITAKNKALSNKSGRGEIYKEVEGAGGATLLSKKYFQSSEIITISALDNQNLINIGLIKIDVEGSELDVIEGSFHTLAENNYPPILFECWEDERGQRKEKLFQYVKSLGYSISTIYSYPEMYLATHI